MAISQINTNSIASGAVSAADLASGSVGATQLASTLDLTGKTVTLPAGVGGKVLQVVQNTYAVETTSTSISYVSTGLSGSITPSSSSSKILIIAYTGARTTYTNILTLFRGTVSGTNLGNGNSGMVLMYTGGDIRSTASVQYLDSPATTSSQTYTLAMRSSNGTTIIAQENNGQAGIILMEIAA